MDAVVWVPAREGVGFDVALVEMKAGGWARRAGWSSPLWVPAGSRVFRLVPGGGMAWMEQPDLLAEDWCVGPAGAVVAEGAT